MSSHMKFILLAVAALALAFCSLPASAEPIALEATTGNGPFSDVLSVYGTVYAVTESQEQGHSGPVFWYVQDANLADPESVGVFTVLLEGANGQEISDAVGVAYVTVGGVLGTYLGFMSDTEGHPITDADLVAVFGSYTPEATILEVAGQRIYLDAYLANPVPGHPNEVWFRSDLDVVPEPFSMAFMGMAFGSVVAAGLRRRNARKSA